MIAGAILPSAAPSPPGKRARSTSRRASRSTLRRSSSTISVTSLAASIRSVESCPPPA
jgi:hypothetical protein